MNKVALCLHGIAKGKNFKHGGLNVTFENEGKLFFDNFIAPNKADVFIHSWSIESQKEVDLLYKPVCSSYEKGIVFNKPTVVDYIKNILAVIKNKPQELNRLNNIYSRWNSLYKVMRLMQKHEKERGLRYDYVMVSRFDMSLLKTINCADLNENKFYVADWVGGRDGQGDVIPESNLYKNKEINFTYKKGFPTDDEGLLDFWFLSSSELMEHFSTIFIDLEELVLETGMSNHKIALQHIKKIGLLADIDWFLQSEIDFCLTRWMK